MFFNKTRFGGFFYSSNDMTAKKKPSALAQPIKPEDWQIKAAKERITYPGGNGLEKHTTWRSEPYRCPELTHRNSDQRRPIIALTGR